MGAKGLIAPELKDVIFCQNVLTAPLGVNSGIRECCRSFSFAVMYIIGVNKRFSSFYVLDDCRLIFANCMANPNKFL